jgi:DNA-binding CsgD family transcriptional regulator
MSQYAVRRILQPLDNLSRGDLRRALEFVLMFGDVEGPDPFPRDVLDSLARLLGAHTVGYVETPVKVGHGGYQVATRPEPAWLAERLALYGRQDPNHSAYRHGSSQPVAISDVLSRREFRRLEVYDVVCRPLGTEDSVRLYLPAARDQARFFFIDRETWSWTRRERALLQLLRPHLVSWRRRFTSRSADLDGLTMRETEVLRWLATGQTNAQIAQQLFISEGTARKHIEHIYAKLGVHSRTGAAALLRAPLARTNAPDDR